MLRTSPEDCRKTKNEVDKIKNMKREITQNSYDEINKLQTLF